MSDDAPPTDVVFGDDIVLLGLLTAKPVGIAVGGDNGHWDRHNRL